MSEIESSVTRNILGYSSLIYNLLISQKDVKDTGEFLTMLPKPKILSDKVLQDSHVVDIEWEHVEAGTSKGAHSAGTEFRTKNYGDRQTVLDKVFCDLESIQELQQVMLEELRLQGAKIDSLATDVRNLSSHIG